MLLQAQDPLRLQAERPQRRLGARPRQRVPEAWPCGAGAVELVAELADEADPQQQAGDAGDLRLPGRRGRGTPRWRRRGRSARRGSRASAGRPGSSPPSALGDVGERRVEAPVGEPPGEPLLDRAGAAGGGGDVEGLLVEAADGAVVGDPARVGGAGRRSGSGPVSGSTSGSGRGGRAARRPRARGRSACPGWRRRSARRPRARPAPRPRGRRSRRRAASRRPSGRSPPSSRWRPWIGERLAASNGRPARAPSGTSSTAAAPWSGRRRRASGRSRRPSARDRRQLREAALRGAHRHRRVALGELDASRSPRRPRSSTSLTVTSSSRSTKALPPPPSVASAGGVAAASAGERGGEPRTCSARRRSGAAEAERQCRLGAGDRPESRRSVGVLVAGDGAGGVHARGQRSGERKRPRAWS